MNYPLYFSRQKNPFNLTVRKRACVFQGDMGRGALHCSVQSSYIVKVIANFWHLIWVMPTYIFRTGFCPIRHSYCEMQGISELVHFVKQGDQEWLVLLYISTLERSDVHFLGSILQMRKNLEEIRVFCLLACFASLLSISLCLS